MDLLALYYNSVIKENPNATITMTSNEMSVPTSTNYVINAILEVINEKKFGIQHAIPICENGVSRLVFVNQILSCFNDKDTINSIELNKIQLKPVESNSYQPEYSAMNHTIGENIDWIYDLQRFMNEDKTQLLKLFS